MRASVVVEEPSRLVVELARLDGPVLTPGLAVCDDPLTRLQLACGDCQVEAGCPPWERGEEFAMGRLYYRDRYGRVRRQPGAGGLPGIPARSFIMALMVLAGIVVLASLIH